MRIAHKGVIKERHNGTLTVALDNSEICHTCHARGGCSVSGDKDKFLEVSDPGGCFSIGDEVNIIAQKSLGLKAIFLGYLLPFIAVIGCLFAADYYTGKESLAGLLAILGLMIYYGGLWFFRDKMKRVFVFRLEPRL